MLRCLQGNIWLVIMGNKKGLVEKGFEHLAHEWNDQRSILDFSQGSGYKAQWKCSTCSHTWSAKISKRYREGTGCPRCPRGSAKQFSESLSFKYPDLIKEWADNRRPETVRPYSSYRAKWRCATCQSTWRASVHNRTKRKNGCPYCSNRKVRSGKNDLSTAYPTLSKEWSERNNKTPEQVSPGSHFSAWWKCSTCSYEWSATVVSRTQRKRGCPCCAGRICVKGINDIVTLFPCLAEEWADEMDPHSFTKGSSYTARWKCVVCSNIWKAPITNRTRDKSSGCPFCCGRKAIGGKTDLPTTHPHLIEEWDDRREIKTVTAGMSYQAHWKCREEGHSWKAAVHSRANGSGCPHCWNSLLISASEKEVGDYISSIIGGKELVLNDRSIISPYEIDIYIPDLSVGIEFNGEYWHSNTFLLRNRGTSAVEFHQMKRELARRSGVDLYFVWENDWINNRESIHEALRVSLLEKGENPDPILLKLEGDKE